MSGNEEENGTNCETACENTQECEPREDSIEPINFEAQGHHLREIIKDAGRQVKETVEYAKTCEIPEGVDRGEMIANVMLAYRHLEDAAMRIGKSMQAYQGGVSILDKMRDEQIEPNCNPNDEQCAE